MADKLKPSTVEVTKFHTNSDVDGSNNSMHHTTGVGKRQSSPGDHTHDGGTSKQLLEGVTISGVKGTSTALVSVIAALVQLGATDTST